MQVSEMRVQVDLSALETVAQAARMWLDEMSQHITAVLGVPASLLTTASSNPVVALAGSVMDVSEMQRRFDAHRQRPETETEAERRREEYIAQRSKEISRDTLRSDLFRLFGHFSPKHVQRLRQKVFEGKIDGGIYGVQKSDSDEPACIIGWLCRLAQEPVERHKHHWALRPLERWVAPVKPDDTPGTNMLLAVLVELIDEWLLARQVPVWKEFQATTAAAAPISATEWNQPLLT